MGDTDTMLSLSAFAHRWCLGNDPLLVLLNIIGNAGIAFAYFVIAYRLYRATRGRLIGPIMGPATWYLFSGFIAFCGLTHVMDIAIIWWSVYWTQVTITLMTATIAILTAMIFSPTVSRLLNNRPPKLYDDHRAVETSSPYLQKLEEIVKKEGLADHG